MITPPLAQEYKSHLLAHSYQELQFFCFDALCTMSSLKHIWCNIIQDIRYWHIVMKKAACHIDISINLLMRTDVMILFWCWMYHCILNIMDHQQGNKHPSPHSLTLSLALQTKSKVASNLTTPCTGFLQSVWSAITNSSKVLKRSSPRKLEFF